MLNSDITTNYFFGVTELSETIEEGEPHYPLKEHVSMDVHANQIGQWWKRLLEALLSISSNKLKRAERNKGSVLGELNAWFYRTFGALPYIIIAWVIFVGFVEPRFLSGTNLFIVSRQCVYLVIFVSAQMIVILCRGFDISIGSCVGLISIITGLIMVNMAPVVGDVWAVVMGMLVGIGVGTLVGATNGLIVGIFRISPFIVTLAMNVILINLSLTISRGQQIKGLPDVFNEVFSLGRIGIVSIPVLIAIAVVICMYVVLYWTRLGRRFYALGGNPEAAYVSGIRFGPYSFYAFTLCGLLVGIGGVLLTARALAGMPLLGAGLGLESIAAAVIGGISIFGGKGHLVGAVFGAIFFILLRNGMDLMGVGSYPQGIATGAILIMALIVDVYRRS